MWIDTPVRSAVLSAVYTCAYNCRLAQQSSIHVSKSGEKEEQHCAFWNFKQKIDAGTRLLEVEGASYRRLTARDPAWGTAKKQQTRILWSMGVNGAARDVANRHTAFFSRTPPYEVPKSQRSLVRPSAVRHSPAVCLKSGRTRTHTRKGNSGTLWCILHT